MEYKCKTCNKNYSSYQSLWIHNKKYHNIKPQITTQSTLTPTEKPQNICLYCNKSFSRSDSRHRHEKTCKNKKNTINEIEQLKNKSNNITNNTTNNINNGVINKTGEENVNKLSYDDIKDIFRQHKNCLYHAINYVNFNKNIPENHNFYNSSLEGKYINVFNNDKNEIEKKNKKDFFDTILLSSINITNLLYDKIKDSVSKKKQLILTKMINEIKNIAHYRS